MFVLSLFVSRNSFFWWLGEGCAHECDISWISPLTFLFVSSVVQAGADCLANHLVICSEYRCSFAVSLGTCIRNKAICNYGTSRSSSLILFVLFSRKCCFVLSFPVIKNNIQGPVVQSIVSLMNSLVVKMLTVQVSTIHRYFCWKNVGSFCKCKSYSILFFQQKYWGICHI